MYILLYEQVNSNGIQLAGNPTGGGESHVLTSSPTRHIRLPTGKILGQQHAASRAVV